jgi:hypothetical protein
VPYMALDATPEGEAAWFALSSGNAPDRKANHGRPEGRTASASE